MNTEEQLNNAEGALRDICERVEYFVGGPDELNQEINAILDGYWKCKSGRKLPTLPPSPAKGINESMIKKGGNKGAPSIARPNVTPGGRIIPLPPLPTPPANRLMREGLGGGMIEVGRVEEKK